jgi:hypothetical protein
MNCRAALSLAALSIALFVPERASCQGQGGVPVRVPDDPGAASRCINPTTDQIWLTLRRLVTNRNKGGWFSKDADVSIVINANLQTTPALSAPISYPLAAQAKFGDALPGQVSIPIEYTIVSGLVLSQTESAKKVTYTGMGVDVTLINTKQATAFSNIIQALVTATGSGKLSIPSNPYSTAATYLLGFANTAIQNSIKGTDNKDKAVTGALAFNFDPSGSCTGKTATGGDFETTGTKAFLESDGIRNPPAGTAVYVDINQTNNFCWSADLDPAFVLKATPKKAGVACTDASYASKYLPVSNNYDAFFLNKGTVSKVLGGRPSTTALRDRKESLLRCKANGIKDTEKCPGAK